SILQERKDAILSLLSDSDFKVRQLVRPTRQYRFLSLSYGYPQIYSVNSMHEYYDIAFKGEYWKDFFVPLEHPLKRVEVDDCTALLIPFFYSDLHRREVFHSSGEVVGFLNESPLDS